MVTPDVKQTARHKAVNVVQTNSQIAPAKIATARTINARLISSKDVFVPKPSRAITFYLKISTLGCMTGPSLKRKGGL